YSELPAELPVGSDSASLAAAGDVNPWGPVIDYDRCTGCRKCMNFCLFGVYGEAEGRVTVAGPQSCKDKCPACARVCPTGAIVFPKSTESSIDGSEIGDGAANESCLETEVSTDLYAALKARRARSGVALQKEDARAQAEAERARCMEKAGCDCNCETCTDCTCEDPSSPSCDCDCNCNC
ncbi:MAG: ATP-binding protein, partial [Planctomycetota bacterium]